MNVLMKKEIFQIILLILFVNTHLKKKRMLSLAERDSIKYMQLKFLNTKIGKIFSGVISGVTEWGLYVELDKNKCEGLVKINSIGGDYFLFDKNNYSIVGQKHKKKLSTWRYYSSKS